jgi:localization factor PodJL
MSEGNAPTSGKHMDQNTVESLLRRLMERVEESERRYIGALDDLHARLDLLSHTTGAARASGSHEQTETLDRLHSQVSELARRLEQSEQASPLDEFAELGKALSGITDFRPSVAAVEPWAPPAPESGQWPETQFSPGAPGADAPYRAPLFPLVDADEADLDKRLVEMAHRLEHSIEMSMPATALEALNAKMDEIASRFEAALGQTPKLENLQPLERQLSDMGQQLSRVEHGLARINGIEAQLSRLIERVEETPAHIEQAASRAATEAFRLAGAEKPSATERLEAIHRDLVAMNERGRSTDDRLADTLAAVHTSLQQLVQQVEHGMPAAPPVPPAPAPSAGQDAMRSRMPDTDQRYGAAPVFADVQIEKGPPVSEPVPVAKPKEQSLRNRLGAAIPDYRDSEAGRAFRRAKRGEPGKEAVDLDAIEPYRPGAAVLHDAEFDTTDDFVAAARRAAQAAANQAEERGNGGRSRKVRAAASASVAAPLEAQGRRKRPLLIIFAALLLLLSAALFYGRLRSKPEPLPAAPAVEESAPAPPAPAVPPARSGESEVVPPAVPAMGEPHGTQPSANSGESDMLPPVTVGDVEAPVVDAPPAPAKAVTEVPKSASPTADAGTSETTPTPQLASLKTGDPSDFPSGVTVTIEEPKAGSKAPAPPKDETSEAVPANLPLPPAEIGPLALRQAAADGDAKAQYAVALRYAQGQGVASNATEAARWFALAASGSVAPAQYRLAVLYDRGEGVAKDLGRARVWYGRAAELGNIKAMHNLAVAESGREGEKADYAVAAKWYEEAADRGLADSQFNLGILAEHGLGMRKNLVEAYKWFSLAATNGDAEAAKRRELVKLQLPAEALDQAEQAIKAWQPVAVKTEANDVTEQDAWHAEAATPNAETPNKVLVSRAQGLLNKLGYDVGAPDGQLGARTREAIKAFERRNGMAETGEVTVPLVTKLEHLTS